jgi:cysteine desulfurase
MAGGVQQSGWRPGTEPVVLAAGLCRALERWVENRSSWLDHLRELQRHFERELLRHVPEAVIVGQSAERLPTTTQIALPGRDRQALLMGLDLAGVACSTGSACSSGSSEVSHVLRAMGLASEICEGALRFSWGPGTTLAELDFAIDQLVRLARQSHENQI